MQTVIEVRAGKCGRPGKVKFLPFTGKVKTELGFERYTEVCSKKKRGKHSF